MPRWIGPFGAEDRAGMRDQAGPAQELVQDAVLGQQAHPGVDADQERRPERQHDQHQQQRPALGRGAGDGVGHGIAQQQGAQCRCGGDAQRGDPGREVEIVGEQQPEALEVDAELDRRRRVGRVGAERDHQHQHERQQEEDDQPGEGQGDDGAHALLARAAGRHRRPSSAIHPGRGGTGLPACAATLALETIMMRPSSTATR